MPDIPDDVRRRAWLDNVRDFVTRKAREVAKDYSGFPGDVYGETVNRVMAAGRAVLPGGESYADELQRVKEAREEDYPGAYSVIPEVRKRALAQAAQDSGVSAAIGVVGPIAYRSGAGQRFFHGGPEAITRVDPEKLQARDTGDWGPGFYGSKTNDLAEEYATHANIAGNVRRSGVVSSFSLPDATIAHVPTPRDGRRFALDLSPAEVQAIRDFHGGQFEPVLSAEALQKVNAWLRATGRAQAMTAGGMEDIVVLDPRAAVFDGSYPVDPR